MRVASNIILGIVFILLAQPLVYTAHEAQQQIDRYLIHAVTVGDAGAVKESIKLGALVDPIIEAPLNIAVSRWRMGMDEWEIVKILLDAGASVDSRDHFGCTPLHAAMSSHHSGTEVAHAILESKLCCVIKKACELEPLFLALLLGDYIEEVPQEQREEGRCFRFDFGTDDFHHRFFASKGFTEWTILSAMLKFASGMDWDDLRNPDQASAREEHRAACSSLVNARTNAGETPLMHAVGHWKKSVELTRFLLAIPELDIDAKDCAGNDALFYARRKKKVVKLLQDARAEREQKRRMLDDVKDDAEEHAFAVKRKITEIEEE